MKASIPICAALALSVMILVAILGWSPYRMVGDPEAPAASAQSRANEEEAIAESDSQWISYLQAEAGSRVRLERPAADGDSIARDDDGNIISSIIGTIESLGPLTDDEMERIRQLHNSNRDMWADRVESLNRLSSNSNPESLANLGDAMWQSEAFSHINNALDRDLYFVQDSRHSTLPVSERVFFATTSIKRGDTTLDVTVALPYDDYPEIAAAREYKADMQDFYWNSLAEEFNALPYGTRKDAFEKLQSDRTRESILRNFLKARTRLDSSNYTLSVAPRR